MEREEEGRGGCASARFDRSIFSFMCEWESMILLVFSFMCEWESDTFDFQLLCMCACFSNLYDCDIIK